MKPDEDLTQGVVLRRQRQLAVQALSHYPISFRRIDLVSDNTNSIYRVSADDGALYALRVVAPFWRSEDNLRAEVAWLNALSQDTAIPLPRIIPTVKNEPFIRLPASHGGPDRRAVLMTWLPGILLGGRLTVGNVKKMGALTGKLHLHAQTWQIPEDFPRRTFEQFLGRGEPNVLFTGDCLGQCSAEDVEVLHATRRQVESAYGDLNGNDLRVIHCDLWHDNIKIFKGKLAPFDFEDTILGHRIHDIAMALLDLAEEVGTDEYPKMLRAYKKGYQSVSPFPEGNILNFQLGRMLWQLNWVARFAPDYFAGAAAFKTGVLRRALSTGRLVGPLRP
jgi:Ser/Thr protein kinase RdoA (MazF antagonist)